MEVGLTVAALAGVTDQVTGIFAEYDDDAPVGSVVTEPDIVIGVISCTTTLFTPDPSCAVTTIVACTTPAGNALATVKTVACPVVVDDRDMAPAVAVETAHVALLLAVKESVPFGAKMVDTGSGVTTRGMAGASMAITLP